MALRDAYVKGGGNGVNSYVFPTLTTAGGNELILVLSDESQDTSTISTITATGLVFTKINSISKGATHGNVEIWKAFTVAPFSGAITVNFAGNNFPQAAGIAVAYSSSSTTIGANGAVAASGTPASPSTAIVTTVANSLVVAGMGSDSAHTLTAGSNQTLVDTSLSGGSASEIGLIEQTAITPLRATSVTMNGSDTTGSDSALVAVEILASSIFPRGNKLRPHAFSPGLAR